jgi:hypothetical protein
METSRKDLSGGKEGIMNAHLKPPQPRLSMGARAALALAIVMGGCNLNEVEVPELSGPSEIGTALRLTATPDVITADGFSTSLIQVQAFDQNGGALAGRSIVLALADNTTQAFADIGTLNATSGARLRAAEAIVVTGANGVAQAVYTAPARTDFTADSFVTVAARPVGTDATGIEYRFVKIELRSAEPRLFPQKEGNAAPTCNFVVEAPQGSTSCSGPMVCTVKVNTSVLFQDASSDGDGTIVRYEWFFQDGSNVEYAIDTNHVFRSTGVFGVVHRVTDNNGAATACTASITVN